MMNTRLDYTATDSLLTITQVSLAVVFILALLWLHPCLDNGEM